MWGLDKDAVHLFISIKLGYEFKELSAGEVFDTRLIDLLLEVRSMARKENVFAIADHIRDMLKELVIILDDTSAGTYWKRQLALY